MGQRAFEKCKPYFVRTAQFKDKVTCCCRQHVEMRSLFKSCMQFRKRLLSREGSSEVKLYESLSELVDDTLCTHSANTHQHKISCLDRLCSECGVCKFSMLPGELDESDVQISWERYEYKNVKVKGDKMIRKLVLILRNYFETSHARGPQDAAGGFIKKQADLAVIRGTHVIQSSSDLFDYAQSNLSTTADSSKCSRRIFRYVDSVNRDRDRNFLPVKENRKIHRVRSFNDGEIFVRKLSCYSCQSCIVGNYSTCMNDAQLGTYNKIKMVKESEHNDTDADSDNDEGVDDETNICDFVSKGTIFAVKADDTDCPYYILRASKDPIILRKTATDKWGASYHQGNKVIYVTTLTLLIITHSN
ncbi:unnamed protein product [Mytilus coruscus]|uniref:Uncharacterized protein n=1 Tax=Mytilus coruscus TaxID=42192 RepID=A0A6J8EWP9_MYTCO|nr:unnamed protein product [Mytilus coruscus]